MNSAWELFLHDLRDTLNAENKLVHALGEMARESHNERLRDAFTEHRHQTEQHAQRLVDVFRLLGQTPEQADCKGIDGLSDEKQEIMKRHPAEELLDFINVGAAIKSERYEISAYETLILMAEQMGARQCAQLLRHNLEEEKVALDKLQIFVPLVKPAANAIREVHEGGLPTKAA